MPRGFTLLEVLVALFIAAVTLTAASRATGLAVDGLNVDRERTLALWVAKNQLALAQTDPAGTTADSGRERQANLDLDWRREVLPTANHRIRQVRVTVRRADAPDRVLVRLTGYRAAP